MKNYCGTEFCHICSKPGICPEFKKCFGHKPYITCVVAMTSFDGIMGSVEEWGCVQ